VAQIVKTVEQATTEELLRGLAGRFMHVSINEHTQVNDVDGSIEVHNVWFAGKIAGFEKSELFYDWVKQEPLETPEIHHTLLMTDGTGWVLSKTALEIQEITQEEFTEMVASEQAKQAVEEVVKPENTILNPPNDLIVPSNVIQMPGRDF
jgi:hypothetical protein